MYRTSSALDLLRFGGRIGRVRWWIAFFFSRLAIQMVEDLVSQPYTHAQWLWLAGFILITWIFLASCAKRFHDQGHSSWWLALAFIPIVGKFALALWLGFLKGEPTANRYGAVPPTWWQTAPANPPASAVDAESVTDSHSEPTTVPQDRAPGDA